MLRPSWATPPRSASSPTSTRVDQRAEWIHDSSDHTLAGVARDALGLVGIPEVRDQALQLLAELTE